jgi:hypothetical protein
VGTNEPENLLAYKRFDNTRPSHAFAAHADDWRPGDPDWGAGKGKALIGLLNYLAAHHVNSIFLMPMNIGGDGQDVWPWVGAPERKGSPSNDNLHYDIIDKGTNKSHIPVDDPELYLAPGPSQRRAVNRPDELILGVAAAAGG